MGNFIAKALVLLIGLWMIVGGGSCVAMAGFNILGMIGLGVGLLGGWIIWVVFKPSSPPEPANAARAHEPTTGLPPKEEK